MDKTVSVIIPLYNVEPYIERCLESVYRQSYKNIEIIVVNDGSTDKSREKAEESLKNSPLKYQLLDNPQNMGLSFTRNHGIDAASGEYLFFMDSDDVINETCIEHLVKGKIDGGYDLVMTEYRTFTDEKAFGFDSSEYQCADAVYKNHSDILRMHGYVWGMLYDRKNLNERKLYFCEKAKYMEDVLFNTAYMLDIKNIAVVSSAVYGYYIRSGSLARVGDRIKIASRNLECAYLFDELYVNDRFADHAKEIIEDRRYVRNCYYGELKQIGFRNYRKLQKVLEGKGYKNDGCALRKFIKKAGPGFKDGIAERIMSFMPMEVWIYRFAMYLKSNKKR